MASNSHTDLLMYCYNLGQQVIHPKITGITTNPGHLESSEFMTLEYAGVTQ